MFMFFFITIVFFSIYSGCELYCVFLEYLYQNMKSYLVRNNCRKLLIYGNDCEMLFQAYLIVFVGYS